MISNPVPGGQRFVRPDRAAQYVLAGRAVWDGERLRFLAGPEEIVERQRRAALNASDADREFRANRGARVYWNGAQHPNSCHLPGTASVFRRQGQRPSR